MHGAFGNLFCRVRVRLYRLAIQAPPHNLSPRYNICPTDPVDMVTERAGTGADIDIFNLPSSHAADCSCEGLRAPRRI
jgi:putative SOS response-associated peptidase YedK